MKILWKLSLAFALTWIAVVAVGATAWGVTYGVTGEPTFAHPDTLALTGFGSGVVSFVYALAMFEQKPWEG